MNPKVKTYAPLDFIKSDEDWVNCLNECVKPDDGDALRLALGDMARAKGLFRVAEEAGLTRQGLRKALSENGNPGMKTLLNILKVLGMRPTVSQI